MSRPAPTRQGVPARCPACAAVICMEPARPVGEAPCPYCGRMLWFVYLPERVLYYTVEEVSRRKRDKIVEVFSPRVTKDDRGFWTGLHMDSLDYAELVLDMEDVVKVRVLDEEAEKVRSLADLIDYLVLQCPERE